MKRCIHCKCEKDESAFNREHVLPESFGMFEDNLVLHCVCFDCNDTYGRTLDLKLARDTMEGLRRFQVGVKEPREFKSLGRKSTSYVEFKEGRLRGARGYHVKAPDGTDLGVAPSPHVWFSSDTHAETDPYPLDALPTKDDLLALGFEPGTLKIRTEGEKDTEKIRAALAAKGFPFELVSSSPPPTGAVHAEAVFKIAEPEFRAVTKIALNYLASVTSAELVLMDSFDEARHFARYGIKPPKRIVHARTNRAYFLDAGGERREGHHLSVEQIGEEVVAQVCLLGLTRFTIRLAASGVLLPVPFSHFFDVKTNQIVRTWPAPIPPDARDDDAHFDEGDTTGINPP